MAQFRIAHLRRQGQDMIIVPLDRSFGHKLNTDQNEICAGLQACARGAGLAGTVVPVWDAGGEKMAFLAPRPWHPFFSSLSLADVEANINKTLTCA